MKENYMEKSKYIVLFLLIGLGIFLRSFNMANIPPHPSLDEVSIGYNSYSVMQTGKDEYGEEFPILLRSYDDWRPSYYIYLVMPFIGLLGLDVLAVRLPSLILSIATLVSVFFLVKEILTIGKSKFNIYNISFFTTLLLAISPWHIYISRLGHEVNLFFSTFIMGLLFFYKFLNTKNNWNIFLSSIFFAVSFTSYQSGKIVIPLMVILLFVIYRKILLKRKKIMLYSFFLGIIISLPVLIQTLRPEALIRFQGTNIFSNIDPLLMNSAEKVLKAKGSGDFLGQILNNRRLVYIGLPSSAFVSHLDPQWLFKNSGDEPFKSPGLGLFYIFEAFTMIFGFILLVSKKIIRKNEKIMLMIWVFIAIIPGSITTGYPHAMRIFQVLPFPQIISAFFIALILAKLPKFAFYIVILLIIIPSLFWLHKSYFQEFPKKTAYQFQYGVLEAFNKSGELDDKYSEVYVSNKENLFQSYMFYLYQTIYDPLKYQKEGGTISGGFEEKHKIGKYKFGYEVKRGNNLLISNPNEIKDGKIIDKVYFPDGREAIWLIEY